MFFSAVEQFSINLQAQDVTIQEATGGAELLASHLKSLKMESQINHLYEQVITVFNINRRAEAFS